MRSAHRPSTSVRHPLQPLAPGVLAGALRTAATFLLPLMSLCFCGALRADEVPLKDQPHLRRPVAAAWLAGSELLAVANQRSGSISVVDIKKRKVLAEVAVGEQLAHVAALPTAGWLLAVDEPRHELLVLRWDAGELQVDQRIAVSRYPVHIAVSPDGSRCTVASLWSRTITSFDVEPAEGAAAPRLTRRNELVLSYAPGEQLFLPDGEHVLVADAFTGQMDLLDVTAQRAVKVPTNNVFRIYAMALSTDQREVFCCPAIAAAIAAVVGRTRRRRAERQGQNTDQLRGRVLGGGAAQQRQAGASHH